uniref:Homeobox domain-containing protein n=1 Tax=Polytomella parva TaxID=51329 RepID=A0A7S0YF31_9CHLO|mmetsp:Transcript_23312/g.41383  ORF Transcript_23312/g.41383 Transcript_23312/m.41383 type:complete len:411 (+) Transcript_23312:194-1426(+)|eukprot:CAMPEP_0175040966 /NCGR_PEP_ID=MMETSP0052_2-20121109/1615_1 /TAXON_ID=51329 ORGANISM="Polytomella parva, Strain SAG 63-3" /NCGR_SAMPLE_ID=MMETSP0052_2 /ASSEMBLY_ACC=CAM_ASM_000194 /LENGTH=410 /DNA_ID=CAMNT_0016303353 /DNA_START=146 /DNA_END=1378 /DNA_ORIENTATION=+
MQSPSTVSPQAKPLQTIVPVPSSPSPIIDYTSVPCIPPPTTQDRLNSILEPKFSDLKLEELRRGIKLFASDRDWEKFHTPRNLLLALMGEVGELTEIFQWKGESCSKDLPEFTPMEREQVGEELSDVLLYLVRLADVCGIDLSKAVLDKLQRNGEKYPVSACKGSAAKYTAYINRRDNMPEYDRPSMSEDPSKRKRFSGQQLDHLSEIARNANWSLASLSYEEREKVCADLGITKDRLQNFFNNRKPKDMKKAKIRMDGQDESSSEHISGPPPMSQGPPTPMSVSMPLGVVQGSNSVTSAPTSLPLSSMPSVATMQAVAQILPGAPQHLTSHLPQLHHAPQSLASVLVKQESTNGAASIADVLAAAVEASGVVTGVPDHSVTNAALAAVAAVPLCTALGQVPTGPIPGSL